MKIRFFIDFNQDLGNIFLENCAFHIKTIKFATGFESDLHTVMMLIDLQKAFDTINHKILINKIKFLGFSKNVILWSKSYLSYRKFKVKLNKYFSKAGQLLCRVP